jgi:hypothetical protein
VLLFKLCCSTAVGLLLEISGGFSGGFIDQVLQAILAVLKMAFVKMSEN